MTSQNTTIESTPKEEEEDEEEEKIEKPETNVKIIENKDVNSEEEKEINKNIEEKEEGTDEKGEEENNEKEIEKEEKEINDLREKEEEEKEIDEKDGVKINKENVEKESETEGNNENKQEEEDNIKEKEKEIDKDSEKVVCKETNSEKTIVNNVLTEKTNENKSECDVNIVKTEPLSESEPCDKNDKPEGKINKIKSEKLDDENETKNKEKEETIKIKKEKEDNLEFNENNVKKEKPDESDENCSSKDTSFEDEETEELLRQSNALLDHVTTHEHAFDSRPVEGDSRFVDYNEVISKPIWIEDMRRKVNERVYSRLADLVADIRLMLENTYRFFGAYNSFTKRALKVEHALEQRLALLPADIRAQCAMAPSELSEEEERNELPAILRKKRSEVSSRLLRRVMDERNKREKARRQKHLTESTPQRETISQRRYKESLAWERDCLLVSGVDEEIKSMWELAQIGQWLGLAETALHIEVPSQWEVERMLLLPQQSRALASVMTALLTPPNTRTHLPLMPPMPYRMWTHKLTSRVARWYRLKPKHAMESSGIEPRFWEIVGSKNPLEEYAFHELTLHQRVWLLKSLCDNVYTAQKSVRECIAEQSEDSRISILGDSENSENLRATILGEDVDGRLYITFPGLMGREVRIYREDPSKHIKKPRVKEQNGEKVPRRRKRGTAWQNGKIHKRKKKVRRKEEESDSSSNNKDSSRSEDEPKESEKEKEITKENGIEKESAKDEKSQGSEEEGKVNPEESKEIVTPILDEILNRVISDCEDDSKFPARATSLSPICDFLGFDVPPASSPEPKTREPLYQPPEWLSPDPEEFYLVADSLDTLRALAAQVHYDSTSKRTRGACEKEARLAKSLKTLAEEYETWELEIESIERTARERLYKDYQDSKRRSKNYVDPNERTWREFLNPAPEPVPKEEPTSNIVMKSSCRKEELSARASRLLRRQEDASPAADIQENENAEEARREFHFRKAKVRNEENLTLLAKELEGVLDSDSDPFFSEDDEDDGSDTWLPPEEKRRKSKSRKSESEVEKEGQQQQPIDEEIGAEIVNSDVNTTPAKETNELIDPNKIKVENGIDKPETQLAEPQNPPPKVVVTPPQRIQVSTSLMDPNTMVRMQQPSQPPQQPIPNLLPPSQRFLVRQNTPSQYVGATHTPVHRAPVQTPMYMPRNTPPRGGGGVRPRFITHPQQLRQTPIRGQSSVQPVIVSTMSLATNSQTSPKQPMGGTPRKRRLNMSPMNASPAKVSNSKPSSIVYLSDDDDIEIIEPVHTTPKSSPTKLLVNRPNITITPVKKTQPSPITPPSTRPVLEPHLVRHFSKKGVDIFLDPRSSRNMPSATSCPSSTKTNASSDKLIIVNTDTGSHYALLKPDGSKVILTPSQLAALREQNGGTLLPLLNR